MSRLSPPIPEGVCIMQLWKMETLSISKTKTFECYLIFRKILENSEDVGDFCNNN